ncbi:hypothetical protein HBI56_203440 [Parastagonospora nodorum]|uniref:BTB domain-containing protein n=2 Tax=Phaeosphaeria nodorum (strain SN15 / ATCC MYA-4574 / FGSC 10173) TaxID=321614 RepID=A0A7U2FER1_PHANO|nr:hypothetical protein SNOG_12202 [Parastagonospora nodorum SN15]KAH3910503.1 hypothetical protein HBH56_142620 [Parastagonospora nodorum]EAT80614.2 hypothetical protein SNOG_12202 [Parastagonospora nodorum SN15]KAH3927787.1 hypothetical protein HBH54_147810 [Parastagonospora nodorum]KAH3961950.1 hypothetical protein HBH51_179140 [Parastagonospora nodorum]KAH3997753.1 hypothetical protein HBI10_138380 [Parastagonospora nodorum]
MDYSDESDTVSVNNDNEMALKSARIPVDEAFDLSSKIITIKAGPPPSTTTLKIHHAVLVRSSEYFKRVLKHEWASLRSDPDTLDMGPTHTASDIKTYCNWLYSGTIPTRNFDDEDGAKSDYIFIDLASAYAFGEQIMDQSYKRCALETLAGVQIGAPDYPCAEAFVIVYDGTPEGSPARRMLVDMYAYGAVDSKCWASAFEALPKEALVDVLRAMVRVRRENTGRPWREIGGYWEGERE